MGYEQFFQSALVGPNWAHGTWWQKWWKSIGKVLDAQDALMETAYRVRNPDGAVALGYSDALDRQGDDRMLPRGGTGPTVSDETDASYAARLKSAWTTWGQDPDTGGGAGSVLGILRQLKIAGFPIEPTPPNYLTTGGFLVNHIGRIYQLIDDAVSVVGDTQVCVNRQQLDGTVTGTLPGWTFDARDQFYSEWGLVFVVDIPSLTNVECPARSRLNGICQRWKSGSARYAGCAIVPYADSAKCWGWPLGTHWGDASLNWGANGARFIDPE